MSRIILIETSTSVLSTALAQDGEVITSRRCDTPRSHSAMTAPLVQQMLQEQGLKASDCDAVAVSSGPGSYTGLRVGSSTAKGLCFGAGIPLVAVGTLEVVVCGAIGQGLVPADCRYIIPMIDARRMEVYTCIYALKDAKWQKVSDVTPLIVENGSFGKELSEGKCLFVGDGAAKCSDVLSGPNTVIVPTVPEARYMAESAFRAFNEKRFEDTAYFEPFYLKDFIATVSRKKLF